MEGSPCRATAYVAVLAGLVGIALVAGCVARSFSGQETAQSRAAAHRAKAAAGVRGSVREARSLVDVAATPRGWSPVAYQGGQISVPSRWFVENPGTICGQRDQGRVFIAEPVRTLTTLGCGPAANVVTIRVASTAAVHTPTRHGSTAYRSRSGVNASVAAWFISSEGSASTSVSVARWPGECWPRSRIRRCRSFSPARACPSRPIGGTSRSVGCVSRSHKRGKPCRRTGGADAPTTSARTS